VFERRRTDSQERHLSEGPAQPDFFCACVKIERRLHVNFFLTVAGGNDFNTNFWSFEEAGAIAEIFPSFLGCPCDVGCADAVSG